MTSGHGNLEIGKVSATQSGPHTHKHTQAPHTQGTKGGKGSSIRYGGKWDPKHIEYCWAKDPTCRSCRIAGHFAAVCKKPSHYIKTVEEKSASTLASTSAAISVEDCACTLCTANNDQVNVVDIHHAELEKKLLLSGKYIKFEVDTGAAVTLISFKDRSWITWLMAKNGLLDVHPGKCSKVERN